MPMVCLASCLGMPHLEKESVTCNDENDKPRATDHRYANKREKSYHTATPKHAGLMR